MSESEPTPTYQSFAVSEADLEVIKMYTTVKQMSMRDFYATAYARMSEERERWSPRDDMERFPWLGNPVGLKRLSAVVHEEQVAAIQRWAETDGMKKSDVYYTAVYYEVRRARAELKKMGVPLRVSSYDGDT